VATYLVPPLPVKTQVLRAIGEACLPLALEFAWRPHQMTIIDFVGQGAICFLLLFSFQFEETFELEVDARGIRKVQNGQVKRLIACDRIRYAKESGRGSYRRLTVSEHVLCGVPFRSLIVPLRTPDYELIKATVLNWLEHPRISTERIYS